MKSFCRRGRLSAPVVSLLMVTLLLLNAPPAPVKAQTGARVRPAVLVLDVQRNAGAVFVTPVTVYEEGKFFPPVPPQGGVAGRRSFVEVNFRSGLVYHLVFGGGHAGTVRIKQGYWEDGSYAYGELFPSAEAGERIRGQLHALATNLPDLARPSFSRRAPTPEERAAALEVAKSTYMENKVPAGALAKMEVDNLTAIDVDGDGRAEMVGSFKVPQPGDDAAPPHFLFLIIEAEGDGYRAARAEYRFNPKQDQYPLGREMLSDYLDIDGDGTSEVVTVFTARDFRDTFRIYQKKGGKWAHVFSGGGNVQ